MKEITFFNGTPHDIHIIEGSPNCGVKFDATIRKYVVEELDGVFTHTVIKTIPSNGMLSATFEVEDGGMIDLVPVRNKKVRSIDPLPDSDVVIVSALYYSAAQSMGWDMSRIYTVIDPVYTPDGKTVLGCLAIGRV